MCNKCETSCKLVREERSILNWISKKIVFHKSAHIENVKWMFRECPDEILCILRWLLVPLSLEYPIKAKGKRTIKTIRLSLVIQTRCTLHDGLCKQHEQPGIIAERVNWNDTRCIKGNKLFKESRAMRLKANFVRPSSRDNGFSRYAWNFAPRTAGRTSTRAIRHEICITLKRTREFPSWEKQRCLPTRFLQSDWNSEGIRTNMLHFYKLIKFKWRNNCKTLRCWKQSVSKA